MKFNIVYKKENEWFIGHIQEYPDYESQGETLDELKENLIEIYTDIHTEIFCSNLPFSGFSRCNQRTINLHFKNQNWISIEDGLAKRIRCHH